MTIEYLKKAEKTAATGEDDKRRIVADMPGAIEAGGEERARDLDGWNGDIVMSDAEIEAAIAQVPEQALRDIEFSRARVKSFAEAQLASMQEFDTGVSPGLVCGQRLIPIETAGC